jgi:hypothetical protein
VLAAGLALVVGVVLGTTARFAPTASAQPTGITLSKTCTSATVAVTGTVTCSVIVDVTAAVAVPETSTGVAFQVAITGAATGSGSNPVYGQATLLQGTSGATMTTTSTLGVILQTVNVVNPLGGVQMIQIGCADSTATNVCNFVAGDRITITEGLQGAVGGGISESIAFAAGTAGAATLGTPVALPPLLTVNPATLIGATIATVCNPTSIISGTAAGGQTSCTTTLTDNDIFPTFVAGGSVRVSLSNAPAGTTFQDGSTVLVLQCGVNGAPQSCQNVTFNIRSNSAGVAGTVSLVVDYTPSLPAVDAAATVTNANVLTITAALASTVAKSCTVTPDGIPASLAASTTTVYVRVGGTVTCTVTITNATPVVAGTVPAISGPASVTLTNASFGGNTGAQTFTCASVAGTPTCTFVETFNPTVACVNMSQSIVFTPAGGTPVTFPGVAVVGPITGQTGTFPLFVLPKANTGVECPGTVATLVQPTDLAFACATNPALGSILGDPIFAPVPGPFITTPNVAGVGILPEALVCKVIPTVNGVAATVAPAKIEVSSINGTLIDASGRLTTNLRIECGNISGVFITPGLSPILPTINKNNCTGVQFAVTGLGVGFVELNARYEPAAFAVADGIIEIEAKALVAFVAPVVTVNLGLSPNPVVVGATGIATSRFNRTVVCAGATTICIDPTTGLPIAINLGSVLNGSVVYTIDDSSIATWAAAAPTASTATPSSTAGFQTNANQAVVRCGFFPTTTLPSAGFPSTTGGLANFFGGCETTQATYLGKVAGFTNISATFIPDLPGAYGNASGFIGSTAGIALPPGVAGVGNSPSSVAASLGALAGQYANTGNPTSIRALEVVGAAPVGDVQLARGCNNVSPTVTESSSAYAARVNPSAALVAIWEHQAATNTFRGWSPAAGAPNDLPGVTRLKPVFVCVSGPAALAQPPA